MNDRMSLTCEVGGWWKRTRASKSLLGTLLALSSLVWRFLRESTPEQRRRRYGDMEYDWEHRVDTTAATVSARDRFIGLLNSPYQPTDPELFKEMMAELPVRFEEFTFIDVGSGKGRTLLIAADYSFRRIVGIELLPALHCVAQQNIASYPRTAQIELICTDASSFQFPAEPLVIYLFNPLPRLSLVKMVTNLERSLLSSPRAAWIVYHNPLEQDVILQSGRFRKAAATDSYSVLVWE
jgi:SAM-dependent methyltransferase